MSLRILLVDDQPEVLDVLRRILADEKGIDGEPYRVEVESDHRHALERLHGERFEVVVVDMASPARHDEGLDVVRALSARSPVTIVLTAHPSYPNCVESMRAGAWDYLEKNPHDDTDPYDRLLASIRRGCEERLSRPDLGCPDPNARWAHEHFADLVERYPGEVVAILDEAVVDHAPEYAQLAERVEDRQRFPLVRPYLFAVPDPTGETAE